MQPSLHGPIAIDSVTAAGRTLSYPYWLALAGVLAATAAIRWRLLDVPLDRDEGEFAYMAQQLLRGVPPYVSGYAMKMPGIYLAYALVLLVFGETARGVHLGLLVVNLATVVVLFLLARRLYGPLVGLLSAGAYALLSLVPGVHGCAAQAEHFVNLPVLGALLLLLAASDVPAAGSARSGLAGRLARLAGCGFLLGLAMIIKQQSAPFPLFALALIVVANWRQPLRLQFAAWCVFLAAAALPLATVCLVEWQLGLFPKFWFWTVDYAGKYASGVPWNIAARVLRQLGWQLVISVPVLAGLLLWGLSALAWSQQASRHRVLMLSWFVVSFISVGSHFWLHGFVLLLPAASVLIALGCVALAQMGEHVESLPGQTAMTVAVAVVAVLATFWGQRDYLFRLEPKDVSRITYGGNPFPEAIPIAQYISRHSREQGPILVLGSEPEIYFYTGRRAVTGHIYMYPLLEKQPYAERMQREMLDEIEAADPEFVVHVHCDSSWISHALADRALLEWLPDYVHERYERVGVVDIQTVEHTAYVWGPDAARYQPLSEVWLEIYQRKGGARSRERVSQGPQANPG